MNQQVTTLEALLADLEQRGIKLRVEGDRLRYSAPHGALTPPLMAQLKERKAELLSFLRHTLPTSFAQRRFWTLQQLNPTSSFYNVPFVFRLSGPLDVAVLRRSFDMIVNRHEVLRTTLEQVDGQLMQLVAPTGAMNLAVVDFQDCPADQQAATVQQRLHSEMEHPFELARESGLRALLIQTGAEEFILQLCFHNTLFDQSSLLVLLKELSAQYAAIVAGVPSALPLPTQYAEYVDWQEALEKQGMDDRQEYWREWFSRGEPPKWCWNPSKPPPETPGFHTHVPWLRCSQELTQQLKALSQRNGCTVYLTLLTAYAILLRRYTNCQDITIGTTYSNRNHWKFTSLIGATIDVPALRFTISDEMELSALLRQAKAVVASALTHQDVPFERVSPNLNLPRNGSGPLFRVVFSFFPETPHGQLQLPGVTATFLEEVINELSRPDLYLVFFENPTASEGALTGYWMHKQDVFDADVAETMNRQLGALLAEMVRDPKQSVGALLAACR